MKKILLGLLFSVSILFLHAQEEISGVTPAKSIKVGEQKLDFNGAGLREKFFIDLYVGALYLTEKKSDGNKVINTDESMAITIDIVSDLITSDKMLTAMDEGFEKSTNGNLAPLKEKIQRFKNAFKEEISEGDHFVIAYVAGLGTEVFKNGKKIETIPSLDFKKALFGVWFGDDPVDEDLKEGMLGKG